MKLTEVIVKRPVAAIMIIVAIIVFGFSSMLAMPQELTPEMEMPMLITYTVYPGAGPEDVEKLVTREIESSIGNLSGIKSITSQSMENISLIIVQYEYGTNMDTAYTDFKERLDTLNNTLPDDARSPTVMELDINAMATMYLTVSSSAKENLLYYVEDEIVPDLEKLSAVTEVSVSGGREEYVRVEIIEEMLQQYGIAINSVIGAVSNVDYSAPLGSASFGSQDLAVRTEVKYQSLEELRNIPITLNTGSTIRLSDVANIYEATKDANSISRYNGNDSISISISKRQSSSAGAVSKQVTSVINQIMAADPDVDIAVVYDSSEQISSSINSITSTMVMAIILSMIVLFVFLGDIKASLIVGSSMPVSLLVTFILMNALGYSMNIVSMSGLVLGVGMMVDNAIVVIDSCFKNSSKERTIIEAAVEGTKFVFLSIAAGTLTTVVVFFPLATIQGMSGQLFGPLGFTIIFALTASLFSAITLVPLFFVQFKPEEKRNAPAALFLKRVERAYGKFLKKILKKKKTVFALVMAFLAVSLWLAGQINVELMPSTDEGIVSIDVGTRPGLKLERIEEIMLGLEEMVAAHPDVEHYTLTSGSSMTGSSSSITAYLESDRKMSTVDVIEQWRLDTKNILDCDIDISSSSASMGSMMGGDTVDVKMVGNDFDILREAAAEVEAAIALHPDIIRTTSSVAETSPTAEIVVDPLKAAAKGLNAQSITSVVYVALNGNEAASIRMDNQEYSIWVEYPKGRYESVSDVANMNIITATGASVPLLDIATVEFSNSPQTILREDSQYSVTVSATPTQAAKYTAVAEVPQWAATVDLPDGVSFATNSMDESMMEEFTSLGLAILTAVFLVFMVMAIQFESIKHSVMVMVCIPFSMIGSFTFLYLANSTISMVSLLGFLVLVGTVVNNGILFVDTTNQYRKSMDVETALVYTGRTRLRPILMTTLTTVLSMIPLAAGIGSGAEMMSGLGITVIGGLTASTLLTLLLLPTFYLIIDGNPDKKARRKQKREQRREERRQQKELRKPQGMQP